MMLIILLDTIFIQPNTGRVLLLMIFAMVSSVVDLKQETGLFYVAEILFGI